MPTCEWMPWKAIRYGSIETENKDVEMTDSETLLISWNAIDQQTARTNSSSLHSTSTKLCNCQLQGRRNGKYIWKWERNLVHETANVPYIYNMGEIVKNDHTNGHTLSAFSLILQTRLISKLLIFLFPFFFIFVHLCGFFCSIRRPFTNERALYSTAKTEKLGDLFFPFRFYLRAFFLFNALMGL